MNLRIKTVQGKLVERGYPCSITGRIDAEMKAAWKKFCEDKNLPLLPVPDAPEVSPELWTGEPELKY